MPRVDWGVSQGVVDNFDRDSQYKPYEGPKPENGVYQWQIKLLKYVAPTDEKLPQLRIGLELIPRTREEKKYAGFFVMLFRSISDRNPMFWVPFLDAIEVREADFRRKTITDGEGNIKSIGQWRNTGKQVIKGELRDEADQTGGTRKTIGWMGPAMAEMEDADGEDYDEDYDDEASEEYDEEWDG